MENVNVTDNANTALNTDSVEAQKPLKLSEFVQREGLELENGKYKPTNKQFKNKQLKGLVNCIDDETNELISLEKIDTSDITSMKELFANSKRTNFKGIEKWDTSKVKTFELMFFNTEFNEDISGWNVSSGRNFQSMFQKATQFNQPIGAEWDTSSATNMIGMFRFAINFNNGGVKFGDKWKMDKVEWTWEMFWGAEKFNQPLNDWKMSSVTKCYKMFMNAKVFNQRLDEWDLSNAVDLSKMFNKAESFNQDLSAWSNKLGKAQNMERMFADTKSLNRTFAWTLNKNYNDTNITKGSPLKLDITLINDEGEQQEKETLQDMGENAPKPTQQLASNKEEFRFYQIIKKDKNLNDEDYKKAINSFLKNWLEYDREELRSWMPKNIRGDYKIYLAKKQDNKICGADGSEWDFICYKVFDYLFLVKVEDKTNGKENVFDILQQKELKPHERRTLTIKQELVDIDEDDDEDLEFERVIDYKCNSLYISLENNKEMYIYNGNSNQNMQNSDRILNIIGALVLAKAYESKMYDFNKMARQAKGVGLMNCHKEICEFDLKFYQNMPVQVHNLPLLNFWDKLDKHYKITNTHEELQDTIARVAQLVSDEMREAENERLKIESQKRDKQNRFFNRAMFVIGLLSLAGAAASVITLIKS